MIADNISGKTDVYGIIGDPISHSFSPIIHNSIAGETKLSLVYVPFNVKPDKLEDAISGAYALKIKGLNVTVPHKKDVIKYLSGVDPIALKVGTVNTLKLTDNGYIGYNTDATGILSSLKREEFDIRNKTVLIIGAGGSSYAAAVAAASHFPEKIIITNRTLANAVELKEHVNKNYKKQAIDIVPLDEIMNIGYCDIVIQTSTVGFGAYSAQSPITDKSFFEDKKVELAFDIIYSPWKTKFLEDAESMGVKTLNGFNMLIYQAIASQEIWFEKTFDEESKEQKRQTLMMYYKSMYNC